MRGNVLAHFIGGEWDQHKVVMREGDVTHGAYRVPIMPKFTLPTPDYRYEPVMVHVEVQEYRLVWRDRDTAVFKLVSLL